MHKVKASQPVFSTAMTLPAGVRNLYVQTTLPDGTVSVSMQPVSAALNVAGAVMKSAEAHKIRTSAATRSESSSMPDYPTLPVKTESDFAEGAVIRQTPAGNIDLGAIWIAKPYAAAAEYYIPAGAEITGNINLNGKFSPHSAPVLYVAGKLTLNASVTIGQATLAVLPGGEVYIREAKANLQQNAVYPAIYVFEGGTFTTDQTSFSCKTIVNEGTFVVNGLFNVNTSCEFYNGASAALQAGEVEVTNKAKLYNDGKVESADFRLNTYAELHNCENGTVAIDGTFYVTNYSVTYQKGVATMDKLEARGGGTLYVNCYTAADDVIAEGAKFYIASGSGLDAGTVYFNSNTELYAAAGSIFSMNEYNASRSGGNVRIVSQAQADQPMAVVVIREKGVSSRYYGTKFEGLMEVVYDNAADAKYVIDAGSLIGGAVMRDKQTVVIAESKCNGGKEPVTPDPEPEPSNLISFETSEGMLAIDGKAVQLGDITVSGGSAAGNHHNVFWAKGGSYDDLAVGGVYNGYLCSTSDEKIWFGTYFSADIGYGDYWGGFVLSANYGRTATSVNYANQFMVWADKGANGSSNCMIGYFDGYTSGYATPMIEFVEPRQVSYLYMANSAITYPYKPTQVDEASYYYKVKITGSLEGKETGSAECFLINGSEKLSDWKKVDLSALGKVDCLTFSPASNEANAYGLLVPAYFAIDEIGLIAEK